MQIGFLGLLTILFIVLKVLGYIAWSWWLVFLPVIFGFVLGIVLLAGVFGLSLWASK